MEVLSERKRQEEKWGQQNHAAAFYYLILAEEVGEVAKEILESPGRPGDDAVNAIRAELIQVAAVAVAMVESLDRNWLKRKVL